MSKIGYRSYKDVDEIIKENNELFGSGSCAALVQHYTKVGETSNWKEGIVVKGSGSKIKRGTAIATFENGKYLNNETGNHAAFYVSQNADGITVVEQFKTLKKPQQRTLKFLGKDANGNFKNPSNNADAFSVIELINVNLVA